MIDDARNNALYNRLRDFSISIIELLKKYSIERGIPYRIREKIDISPNRITKHYLQEVNWNQLLAELGGPIVQSDEYQKAIQVLESDSTVAKHLNTGVGTINSMSLVEKDSILFSLLDQLLEGQNEFRFQESIFDKIYREIENFFYVDTIMNRSFSPIHNFRMDRQKIALGPNLSIIEVSASDIEEMITRLGLMGLGTSSIQSSRDLYPRYALELYLELPKYISTKPEHSFSEQPGVIARNQFDEVCSALRLFKSGGVRRDYIKIENLYWLEEGEGSFVLPAEQVSPQNDYLLVGDEVSTFLEFWNDFQKARQIKRNRIDLAIRRFNFGYERQRLEDKLIDYMIAFESLLLESEAELSYKLALRGAALLGKSPSDRRQKYDEFRQAYNQRSKIAHGNSPNDKIKIGGQESSFENLVGRIERLLRLAIREFLVLCQQQSENQLMQSLDDKIITGYQDKK